LFDHFFHRSRCTYAVTADLDSSVLDQKVNRSGARHYPAHVWAVTAAINQHDEFRMTLTDAGEPAVWPRVHPAFTVFHESTETFSSLWVPFVEDFSAFQHAMVTTIERHRDARELFPQPDVPENTFDISAIPWAGFTGFTLDIENGYQHLAPIITLGRRVRHRDGSSSLPIAVQVHHAAADGFHVARLVNEIQVTSTARSGLLPRAVCPDRCGPLEALPRRQPSITHHAAGPRGYDVDTISESRFTNRERTSTAQECR